MQTTTARDAYLLTEVNTATPQKLQLMLIEAAIRFASQALLHWDNGQDEQAGEALIRCQDIFGEILGGLRPDLDPALVKQVAGIYVFLLRSTTDAHLTKDRKAVEDAIRILQIERDTWQQVCMQLGSRIDGPSVPQPHTNFVG